MLNNFVGEFLILSSTFTGVSRGWAIAATLGVILGAAYMLWLVQRLFYGPESELTASKPADDLHFRELAVLWPLAVLMLVMGLAPSIWLPSIETGIHPPGSKVIMVIQGSVLPRSILPISSQGEGQR
jgi:NADH-quinone oxidoreductase subunit M